MTDTAVKLEPLASLVRSSEDPTVLEAEFTPDEIAVHENEGRAPVMVHVRKAREVPIEGDRIDMVPQRLADEREQGSPPDGGRGYPLD